MDEIIWITWFYYLNAFCIVNDTNLLFWILEQKINVFFVAIYASVRSK